MMTKPLVSGFVLQSVLLISLVFILSFIYPQIAFAQTPIGWWKGENNAADSVGLNNGNIYGDTNFVQGVVGKAFNFDGSGDYILIPYNQKYNFQSNDSFTIDFCVKPSSDAGGYRALVVKSPPSSHWDWGVYMNPDNTFMAGLDNQHLLNSTSQASSDIWSHVSVTYSNGEWELYINGINEDTSSGSFITQSNGGIGIGVKGEDNITGDYFNGAVDEIKIFNYKKEPNEIESNCATAINIPNLKQHSNPWGDDVYDTASSWNPIPTDTSIARWGCALTSGTMILQYFGYNFNPDVINEWFNASGKGYTPNGAVLWPAFSKLTKERQDLGNPKLEFKYKGATTAAIDAELNNGRPAILKYGKTNSQGKTVTHFVVATGKQGNEYLVNDPGSDTNTTKSQVESFWGMNLVNVGSFTPSQTDVSYIVASVPYGFDIQLFDSLGNLINGDYEIESPLVDVTDKDTASGNGISYNTLYIPKPDAGQYKLKVLGSGNYEMYLYLYDTEGGLEDFKFDGNISTEEIFDLYYDKTVSSSSTVEVVPQVEEVNFDNLVSFIDQEYVNGGIKKKSTHTALKTLILVAKKHYENGREFVSRLTLKLSKEAIQKATPKYIKVDTSSELIQKINLLLDSL